METKETQLANPTEDQMAEMRKFSGEESTAGMARIPSLMFNGETGIFARQKMDKDGNVEVNEKGDAVIEQLGEVVDIVIVKVRRKAATDSRKEALVYSNEFDAANEEIALYSDDTREQVDFGLLADLKPKYKSLKMRQVLYVFFQQKMYKMLVKGTSLDPFWKYLASFGKDTVLRYRTVIGVESAENKDGDEYKVMKFAKGDIMPNWQAIWDELKTLDTQISSTAVKRANLLPASEEIKQPDPGDTAAAISEPPAPAGQPPAFTGDPTAVPAPPEDEVDVSQIPF